MNRHKVKLLRFPAKMSAAWVCNFARTMTGAFPSKRSIRRQMGKLRGAQ